MHAWHIVKQSVNVSLVFSLLNSCALQLLPQASITRHPNSPAPPFAAGSRAMWKACI